MKTQSLNSHRFNSLAWFAGAWVALAVGSPALALSPIFEARFNDTTGIELQGGATLGPDGSGVSGKSGDKAYSADTSSAPKAAALLAGDQDPISGLGELTVTAWYKPRADLGLGELFNAVGSLLIWENTKHEWTWRVGAKPTNPEQKMYWFFSGKSPLANWATPGEWTFIAMVWNRAEKKGTFYQGGKSDPLTPAREMMRPDDVEPISEAAKPKRMIGNDPAKMERAFNGEIDNVRFFTKALDAATLEKIRTADVKNEAINLP